MNAKVFVGAAAAVVVVAGVALVAFPRRHAEWTTTSAQALEEFEKGLDSLEKVYTNEAAAHFSKAVELDPSFVSAKAFLVSSKQLLADDPSVKALYAELHKADLSGLTPRERFLVGYMLADHDKDPAKAQKILDDFAARYPDDPFAIEHLATVAATRQDWQESRRLLSHLIEVAPNRVMAYNQLGYLEMGQGRFEESARMFQTYRYIAPDQANPHDSLAELYILIGRYGDARRELDEALRIRPDFCASYQHLMILALMQSRPQDAEEAIRRAEQTNGCPAYPLAVMRCDLAIWPPFLGGDWKAVWTAEQRSCRNADLESGDNVLRYWSALATGRRAEAEAVVKKTRDRLDKLPASAPGRRFVEAVLAHMEGAALLAQGNAGEAAARFRFADERLSYREIGNGIFKLINLTVLARALQAAGDQDEAKKLLDEARSVNADFVDRVEAHALPLPAG